LVALVSGHPWDAKSEKADRNWSWLFTRRVLVRGPGPGLKGEDGRLRGVAQLTINTGNAQYDQMIICVCVIALCNAVKMAITACTQYCILQY